MLTLSKINIVSTEMPQFIQKFYKKSSLLITYINNEHVITQIIASLNLDFLWLLMLAFTVVRLFTNYS